MPSTFRAPLRPVVAPAKAGARTRRLIFCRRAAKRSRSQDWRAAVRTTRRSSRAAAARGTRARKRSPRAASRTPAGSRQGRCLWPAAHLCCCCCCRCCWLYCWLAPARLAAAWLAAALGSRPFRWQQLGWRHRLEMARSHAPGVLAAAEEVAVPLDKFATHQQREKSFSRIIRGTSSPGSPTKTTS